MFLELKNYVKELYSTTSEMYWILLPLIVLLLIVIKIAKNPGKGGDISDIFQRTLISVLLLFFFPFTIDALGDITDAISSHIGDGKNLLHLIKNHSSLEKEGNFWFDFKNYIVWGVAFLSYLVAYLGFFTSIALMHFVWSILYVCAPFMILCYIPTTTSQVTSNLYKGLISVSMWKILWTLLSVFLTKTAINPQTVGTVDWILTITMNLFIGLSMLLIPLFTKSLIGSGLQSVASTLAIAPGLAIAQSIFSMTKLRGRKAFNGMTETASTFANNSKNTNHNFFKRSEKLTSPKKNKKQIKEALNQKKIEKLVQENKEKINRFNDFGGGL